MQTERMGVWAGFKVSWRWWSWRIRATVENRSARSARRGHIIRGTVAWVCNAGRTTSSASCGGAIFPLSSTSSSRGGSRRSINPPVASCLCWRRGFPSSVKNWGSHRRKWRRHSWKPKTQKSSLKICFHRLPPKKYFPLLRKQTNKKEPETENNSSANKKLKTLGKATGRNRGSGCCCCCCNIPLLLLFLHNRFPAACKALESHYDKPLDIQRWEMHNGIPREFSTTRQALSWSREWRELALIISRHFCILYNPVCIMYYTNLYVFLYRLLGTKEVWKYKQVLANT